MALILDTNALSAFADGSPALRRMIDQETDLALPSIVLGEYLFGIRQSRHRKRYEEWLKFHLQIFLVLSAGFVTAERYAEIRLELKAAGQPLPTNDIWIAAMAREHGLAIATRDRHFDVVPGLKTIGW